MSLVAPIFQQGDFGHFGAEMMARGLMGLAANKRAAQDRELHAQEFVQDMALKNKKFEADREDTAREFGLKQQQLDIERQYKSAMADYYKNSKGQAASATLDYNHSLAETQYDFNKRYDELGFNDPNAMMKNPVKAAYNFEHFLKPEFGNANAFPGLRGVSDRLNDTQKALDQFKVPLKVGARWDATAKKGKGDWVGGTQTQVSPLDIVEHLKDPKQADAMANAIEATGRTSKETTPTEFVDSRPSSQHWWIKKTKTVPVTTTKPDEGISSYLQEGQGLDMDNRSTDRIPEMMAPNQTAYKGTGAYRAAAQEQLDANHPAAEAANEGDGEYIAGRTYGGKLYHGGGYLHPENWSQ